MLLCRGEFFMRGLLSAFARVAALAVIIAWPALRQAIAAEEPPQQTQMEAPDADDGGGFMTPRPPRQQSDQPTPQPPPADAPSTEKQGDDLIVHGDADTRIAHFFTGMQAGEVRPMMFATPQRGQCTVNIDFNGGVVAMKCDH